MELSKLNELIKSNFEMISKDSDYLFEVELDKDVLWNLYLDSFPAGTNEIFRERRSKDCSSCRQFVKNFGNIVLIKDNKMTSVWEVETGSEEYQPVLDALSKHVKSFPVTNVWVNKFKSIGIGKNHERLSNGEILTWEHLYLELPKKFVVKSSKSEAELKGNYRDVRNVFKRSLDEITEESVLTTIDLINQNSLPRGTEWKSQLALFLKLKKDYTSLKTEKEKANFAWEQSMKVGSAIGKIRNHSIGTLLIDLSEEVDLDTAVRKYERIVAGENYKRPKAIYTQKMLDDAKKTLTELGYLTALNRRYATLDDITVNNILFSNKDAAKRISGGDIFDEMSSNIPLNPKKFSRVEELSINEFIEKVLPTTNELEVFLENKHSSNMVSLIAPENKDAKSMFKWSNGFGWGYSGNMTDSAMKDRVKSAGGNVDGVLRFSIQWNDDQYDGNDLDAHCVEPGMYEIYYGNRQQLSPSGGMLDVDIIRPNRNVPAVENITWVKKENMKTGTYEFFVENFSHNGGRSGFRAEIEFEGQIYSFEYNKELRQKERVAVAGVYFDGNTFTIKEKLSSNVSSKEIWNLKTNQFVPVSVAMFSPNYWDEQEGIGHKHYFFMLKDCVNNENPNGFYNEFLKEDLMKHKRVFEALGSKMAVKDVDDQLSGLGFSSTKRNDLLVKVKGTSERVLKIKF